jgi:hypothetical protein
MHTRTVEVREGDDVGPVDWDHPIAADKPPIWREAEKHPENYEYNDRTILRICMYDGWPYWTPTPAIQFVGPLNRAEWHFFNSYGVYDDSIRPRRAKGERA